MQRGKDKKGSERDYHQAKIHSCVPLPPHPELSPIFLCSTLHMSVCTVYVSCQKGGHKGEQVGVFGAAHQDMEQQQVIKESRAQKTGCWSCFHL